MGFVASILFLIIDRGSILSMRSSTLALIYYSDITLLREGLLSANNEEVGEI
jgi:hypothetical protein